MKVRDEMIDIIVVGYPKSGNTWVTRLVAELVGCPVVGFLDSDHNEMAREGLNRKSIFQCFKSHHQYHELCNIKTNSRKIIYVIRDPRDICISGAKYFYFERWRFLGKCLRRLPKGILIYSRINQLLTNSLSYRVKKMMQAVIYGSSDIHYWIRIPWVSHYKPYMKSQCLFVKYEDLLCHPERESKRVLEFLGVKREENWIKGAIEKQSFDNKKQEFLKKGELNKASFLRTGKKEQWREKLSEKQKKVFNEKLADELDQFGYPSYDGDT